MWAKPERIGNGAFKGCTSLEEFSVSSDTKSLGESCFEGCTSLESVILWGKLETFPDNCFKNCIALEEISISSENKYIGISAFENCTSLEAVTFWGPSELMAKSRIYSGRLQPIYGKDIAASPDTYSGQLQTLYRGYISYEAKDSLLINKDEQLGALANCLLLYPQINCRYVVVYDPKQQGTDFDAEEIFTSLGYRFVGQTGELMLFSLQ